MSTNVKCQQPVQSQQQKSLEQSVKYVSKLAIKTPERLHWRGSGGIVNFEQVNADWERHWKNLSQT